MSARALLTADIEDAHLAYSFKEAGPLARRDLLDWWDKGHREMPWRREAKDTLSQEQKHEHRRQRLICFEECRPSLNQSHWPT